MKRKADEIKIQNVRYEPMSLTLVDGSYSFVLLLIGAIVAGWHKK